MAGNRKPPEHPSAQLSFLDITPDFGAVPCARRRRSRRTARNPEDAAAGRSASDRLPHDDAETHQLSVPSSGSEEATCRQASRDRAPINGDCEGINSSPHPDKLPKLELGEDLPGLQDPRPTARGP